MDLYAASPEELEALLGSWGEPRFRTGQLRRWLYERGVASFEAMTDLPASLRRRLGDEASLGTLSVVAEQHSRDGTRKRLYRLATGERIESVLMPYGDGRNTACVSTQAGCAMGCTFCATGQMGFARSLTSAQILEQALRFSGELKAEGKRLSNVVLMGMGEPFHNYEASLDAIRRLMSDLGIGARHITVSTVGLAPQIRRFAAEGLQVGLAVSLHAATDAQRSELMPVNRRWPLAELMAACRDYTEASGRRVTFEWALIEGVNDDVRAARRLARLLRGVPAHVNLIPLNPTRGYGGAPTGSGGAERFVATLAEAHVPATVRVRRGIDIDAGCGQLYASVKA